MDYPETQLQIQAIAKPDEAEDLQGKELPEQGGSSSSCAPLADTMKEINWPMPSPARSDDGLAL